MGNHPWSEIKRAREIKRVRDINRADDGLPGADSEPTTGAPQPKPWMTRHASWLRHVAATIVVFLVMWVTFILGMAVIHESINPLLAVFLGLVYGAGAGLAILWLEGE